MARNNDFVIYICEQMASAGWISYRAMFGGYSVYCEGVVVGLVTGDQLFLKPLIELNYPMQPAYPGGKPMYLVDNVDDVIKLAHNVKQIYEKLNFI